MVAREIDAAARKLRTLRNDARARLLLAAVSFGLAIAASQLSPALAVPLLVGGFVACFLWARAFVSRWDLLERLVADRDCYTIPEVRRRAERVATMQRRRALASTVRYLLRHPTPAVETHIRAAAETLETLADELEDDDLALDPASAVACASLIDDVAESPLRNPALPPEDLRSRLTQILAGFRHSEPAL